MAVRFGLLGVGMAGEKHAALLAAQRADTELRAVAAARLASARPLAERHGADALTYPEMLRRDDIDAILVATPSGLHADHTVAALQAGKHVLVEKALEVTLERAQTIIDAERSTGLTVGTIAQRRFTATNGFVGSLVKTGRLGTLVSATVSQPLFRSQAYYDSAAWRGTRELDGGVLMQQGFHLVDLMVSLLGSALEVKALGATRGHDRIDVEDVATVCSRHAKGALLSLMITTSAYGALSGGYALYGTAGSVEVVDDRITQLSLADDRGVVVPTPEVNEDPGEVQLRDFVEAVAERRAPVVTTQDGYDALSYIIQAYRSAGADLATTGV